MMLAGHIRYLLADVCRLHKILAGHIWYRLVDVCWLQKKLQATCNVAEGCVQDMKNRYSKRQMSAYLSVQSKRDALMPRMKLIDHCIQEKGNTGGKSTLHFK